MSELLQFNSYAVKVTMIINPSDVANNYFVFVYLNGELRPIMKYIFRTKPINVVNCTFLAHGYFPKSGC